MPDTAFLFNEFKADVYCHSLPARVARKTRCTSVGYTQAAAECVFKCRFAPACEVSRYELTVTAMTIKRGPSHLVSGPVASSWSMKQAFTQDKLWQASRRFNSIKLIWFEKNHPPFHLPVTRGLMLSLVKCCQLQYNHLSYAWHL